MNKVIKNLLTLAASAVALATVLTQSGCSGYQMGAIKPEAYVDINKIFVPPFVNDTLEPRLSTLVTNTVIKQMQLDGTYEISTEAKADAELRGTITRLEKRQLRSALTDSFQSTELQTFMVIRWALHDPVTGKKFAYSGAKEIDEINADGSNSLKVRPGQNIGRTIIFLDPNFQTSDRSAYPVAAQKAAEQLVSQLSEGW